ncbi:MAG: DUF1636 domain-containing protein [Desertifilum sp. SIO1I2]|nr:DUF1636 domain-containing protein [Desertifilum sp. SIO1I2]
MAKHVMSVCKYCNSVHSQEVDYEHSEGAVLYRELAELHQDWAYKNDLEIRSVGCLWTCDRPCSVSFSATDKATYVLTKVPLSQAAALLEFGELYLKSKAGDIPWKQIPEVLQATDKAKVPPLSQSAAED